MPERPPREDPLADLFGRLPDPRARETPTGQDATTSTPTQNAGDGPPVSRRAAREAAARSEAADATVRPVPDAPARRVAVSAPRASSAAAAPHRPAAPAAATLEDLFTGTSPSDTVQITGVAVDKRKRRLGIWIVLALVVVLVGGIGAGGLWVWNSYQDRIRSFMGWEEPKDYDAGLATGDVTVTIASGDTGQVISQTLFDAGVTKTSGVFYDMLVHSGQNPTFYPGAFRLQQKMTAAAALAALQDPANKLQNTVALREGLTVAQALPVISESLSIPLEDLQAAVADPSQYGVTAPSLEGWLFPATYTFDPGVTPADIIKTMVDRAVSSLDKAGVPEADRERVLTIASIIQREARFEADFYKVSRVIQNRLDPSNQQTFGYLQMDSTATYGYVQTHNGTSPGSFAEAKNDNNPWNTYAVAGLPQGPTGNPGDTAIDAAMHPVDGPWYYFVTVNLDTGETQFTTNLADHDKTVQQLREWCNANPGHDGC